MEKTERATSELSFLLRMLQVIPEAETVEKIYRMLLSLTIGGRTIGFDRAMLFIADSDEGVIRGHLGVDRIVDADSAAKDLSYEDMMRQVFDAYERIDSSDLTLKLRTYSIPFGWHRSALVKAARAAFPVLAEEKLSEFATDPFFEYFETPLYIAIPLKVDGSLRAVLAADKSQRQQPIDIDDISILYSLAQQACQAIENLIASTENQRRFRILLRLEQTLQNADTKEKIEEALKLCLVMIGRAIGGSGAFLRDILRGRTLHVKSVTGYSLDADDNDIAISECFEKILDRVAGRAESMSGDGGHALVDEALSEVLAHFFACPLSNTGEVIGALGVYVETRDGKRERKAFSSSDRKFLELCAGLVAMKLDNREKDERLDRQDQFLEEIRSNLARERERSRIGEKGIEYHEKIEADTRRMRIALQSELSPEKRLPRLEEVLAEIERNSLLYKAEFALPDSHYQMVDIFKVTRHAVGKWKPKAEELGLEVTVRIPPKGPKLLMDEEKMALAIENILRSISSSLRPDEKVLIEGTTTKEKVLLVFADTGIGLPGNLLSRLFMPFSEIESGDERKRSLSLAGEILHTHAGEIKVKTSLNWKTILELSFARMGNQDRRKGQKDRRRRRASDRRVSLKGG